MKQVKNLVMKNMGEHTLTQNNKCYNTATDKMKMYT